MFYVTEKEDNKTATEIVAGREKGIFVLGNFSTKIKARSHSDEIVISFSCTSKN
jgi:hypothetical protein